MSCIKDDLIQKYIDGEATEKEITLIEEHLVSCEACAAKVEHQRFLVNVIIKEINLLASKTIEIPAFVPFSGHKKKHMFTVRRLVFFISAACIFLFVLIITHKKEQKNRNDIIFTQIYDWDNYNANRTLSQQPMVIIYFDREGDVKKYIIE